MSTATTWATITDEPRASEWRAVLGTNRIPVEAPVQRQAALRGQPHEVYMVAVGQLTVTQLDAIAAHLARKFGDATPEQAKAEILAHGLPIRAEGLVISIDARAFL